MIARQRWVGGDPGRRRRMVAEHEASHAVVARELGLGVGTVRIADDGSGHCEFETGTPDQVACVALAAEIWIGELTCRNVGIKIF